MSTSQGKNQRRQLTRSRKSALRRARPTQAEQQRAAQQRDIDRQLRAWTPRRIAAWTLFAAAIVIAVQHVVAHGGWRPIPLSMGWQDLLLGYPMALVLALVGALCLEARPRGR